jgi:hypothetical protein
MVEYSLRLRITGAGDDVSSDINYGTLSRAGIGAGVATTGTSIVAGDNDTTPRFQILTGILCLTTAGASLGLPEAPYHLTLNTGEIVNVTAIAGAAHIANQAEMDHWFTQSNTALAGMVLRLRPLAPGLNYVTGVDGVVSRLRRADFGGLEIRSDDELTPAVIDRMVFRGTRNVTVHALDTVQSTGVKFQIFGEAANNATGLTINGCRVRGIEQDPYGDFTNGLLVGAAAGTGYWPNTDGIVVQGAHSTTRAPWCGDITITNNWLTDVARGVNASGWGLGQITTSGNFVDRYYDDGVNVTHGQSANLWTCEFNTLVRPIGKGSDGDGAGPGENNPHVDAIRGAGGPWATSNFTVKIRGNRAYKGGSRGDIQLLLLSDMNTVAGDSGYHFVGEVSGNVLVGDTTQGLSVENAGDGLAVINNTVVAEKTNPDNLTGIKVGSGSTYSTRIGTQIIQRNICDSLVYGGTPTLADNIITGEGGATISYATVFDGPTFEPLSIDELMTKYARKSAGPADLGGQFDAGAIGSGAITWPTAIPGTTGGAINVIPSIRRDTYVVTFDGSSSTDGNQDGLGDFGTLLPLADPGSQSVINQGQGGSLIADVKTRIAAASAAQKFGTWFIQYDTNSWYASPELGKAEVHYADYINNVLPLVNADAVSGQRVLAWVGTEQGYGVARNGRNQRFQKLLWQDYPGQVINQLDYHLLATSDPSFTSVTAPYVGATDTTAKANGQIQPSMQMPDRSHQDVGGYGWSTDSWIAPYTEAIEGGAPFFAYYPYYSVASTAKTAAGDICQLYGVGNMSGAEFDVLTMAGATHPHFTCTSAGVLQNASGDALKDQFYPFVLRSQRGGLSVDCPMRVSVGSLTGVPQRKTLDGHTWGTLETNDNRGTALAPSNGGRLWKDLGDSDYFEQSFVMDFEPTTDGTNLFFLYHGSGIQIQRTSTNFMRVSNRDKNGTPLGQITTGSGQGLATVANGRFLMFYSVKVDAGAVFQQLILDNGTALVRHSATPVAPVGLTVNVNPAATANTVMRFLAGTTDGGSSTGVSLPTTATNVIGRQGFMWMSTKAVDWSVTANRALFRNSLSDLIDLTTASSGQRPGDGRSVIIQPGGLGYNVGTTVTPYYYDRGGAADFGRNFGTGGDIEVWSRTDPTGVTPGRGIAVTV